MTTLPRCITGGVDTHLDVHVAAALDERGALLGVESFATTRGLQELLAWLATSARSSWSVSKGPGPMGPGSPAISQAEGVRVVEVDRPNRQRRRRKGKSDPQDAIAAARAAHVGRCRRRGQDQGRKRRVHAGFAGGKGLGPQGPDPGAQPDAEPDLDRVPSPSVPSCGASTSTASSSGPRPIGPAPSGTSSPSPSSPCACWPAEPSNSRRRSRDRRHLETLVQDGPGTRANSGVGTDAASALLVAAGDNPERLRSEAAFAHLCGHRSMPAAGRNQRHRLNRSGDRQANSALWQSCSPAWSTTRGPPNTLTDE